MGNFDTLLRWPNIGHPCLVKKAMGTQDTVFKVIFAGVSQDMDLKPLLQNMCFLQPLKDTRQIVQDVFTQDLYKKSVSEVGVIVDNALDMDRWRQELKQGLIPLNVLDIEPAQTSAWDGNNLMFEMQPFPYSLLHYDYAYWVTLQIESKYLAGVTVPQIFNFIHKNAAGYFYNINFHSVYLHQKDWSTFNILHAADSHVAWRNDFIKSTVQNALGGDAARSFINFNENFRYFIHSSNELHRTGKADLIVLTGDLVDYIEITRKFTGGPGIPADNFFFLRNQLISWKRCSEMVVGEELEMPLFTLLGNHDYRPAEYPLIATYELAGGVDLYTSEQYGAFSLTRDEALAYESGKSKDIPYYGATEGIQHQSHLKQVPPTYRACLNPDANYIIPLGKHRLICLDSGPDKDEITGLIDGWLYTDELIGSRYDFIHTTPDGEGFSAEQIQFIEEQVKQVDGLVILACHHPIINFRYVPPPHQFREYEHAQLSPQGKLELSAILFTQEYALILSLFIREYYKRVGAGDNNGAMAVALQIQAFTFDYWAKLFGWPLGGTPYFKKGGREPELGRGVPDEHFPEFFTAITLMTKKKKKAELVITGHTHRSIEYTARWQNGLFTLLHDYYLDGTVEGKSPVQHWQKALPEYADPLSKSTNPQKWWHDHSPLFVQALSVAAPPPPSKTVGFLRIVVQNDIITRVERETWPLLHAFLPQAQASQPFFILASSPP